MSKPRGLADESMVVIVGVSYAICLGVESLC